jgi:hypothetical protein
LCGVRCHLVLENAACCEGGPDIGAKISAQRSPIGAAFWRNGARILGFPRSPWERAMATLRVAFLPQSGWCSAPTQSVGTRSLVGRAFFGAWLGKVARGVNAQKFEVGGNCKPLIGSELQFCIMRKTAELLTLGTFCQAVGGKWRATWFVPLAAWRLGASSCPAKPHAKSRSPQKRQARTDSAPI